MGSRRSDGTCTTWISLDGGADASAAALRAARRDRGVILELDLARGDLAWRVDIAPRTTIADLASMPPGMVGIEAVAAATWQGTRGVRIIPGPCCPELAEIVTPELVGRVVDLLVASGAHVHVVARCSFDARVLAACDRSVGIRMLGARSEHARTVADGLVDLLQRCMVAAVPRVQFGTVGGAMAPLLERLVDLRSAGRRTRMSSRPVPLRRGLADG